MNLIGKNVMKRIKKAIKNPRKAIKYLTTGAYSTYELENVRLKKEFNFFIRNQTHQKILRPWPEIKIAVSELKYFFGLGLTTVRARLFFDEQMNVTIPEVVSKNLYKFHFFEAGLTSILLKFLQAKMVFVDIGAHYGYLSLLASKLVSDKGYVHSFEPTKKTCDVLRSNLSTCTNVKINQMAVWSRNTELEFNEYGDKLSAYNSFTRPRISNFRGTYQKKLIHAVSLDSYFKNDFPDFVKIDAESAELEILKGMERIIHKKKPIISLEVGDINKIQNSKKNVEYLLDRGYEVFEHKDGRIKKHTTKDIYEYDNLLFLRENYYQKI